MFDVVGFHNSSLYEALRASIGPLVSLLHDREDKTRANAAGALGNLVRNSGLLCRPLIEARALQVHPILCLFLNSWASCIKAWPCSIWYVPMSTSSAGGRNMPVNSQYTMHLRCIDQDMETVQIIPLSSAQLLAVLLETDQETTRRICLQSTLLHLWHSAAGEGLTYLSPHLHNDCRRWWR